MSRKRSAKHEKVTTRIMNDERNGDGLGDNVDDVDDDDRKRNEVR